MKKIEAIVKPDRIPVIMSRLSQVHQGTINYYDTWYRRIAESNGEQHTHERNPYGFLFRTKVEVMVDDDQVDAVITAICEGGYAGGMCEGKIFVMPIENSIRIQDPQKEDFNF